MKKGKEVSEGQEDDEEKEDSEKRRESSWGREADCKCVYPSLESSVQEQLQKGVLLAGATWPRSSLLVC